MSSLMGLKNVGPIIPFDQATLKPVGHGSARIKLLTGRNDMSLLAFSDSPVSRAYVQKTLAVPFDMQENVLREMPIQMRIKADQFDTDALSLVKSDQLYKSLSPQTFIDLPAAFTKDGTNEEKLFNFLLHAHRKPWLLDEKSDQFVFKGIDYSKDDLSKLKDYTAETKAFFEKEFDNLKGRGILGKFAGKSTRLRGENYAPVQYDADAIASNPEGFKLILVDELLKSKKRWEDEVTNMFRTPLNYEKVTKDAFVSPVMKEDPVGDQLAAKLFKDFEDLKKKVSKYNLNEDETPSVELEGEDKAAFDKLKGARDKHRLDYRKSLNDYSQALNRLLPKKPMGAGYTTEVKVGEKGKGTKQIKNIELSGNALKQYIKIRSNLKSGNLSRKAISDNIKLLKQFKNYKY